MRHLFDIVTGMLSIVIGAYVEHEIHYDKAGIYLGESLTTWFIAAIIVFLAIMYIADIYEMNNSKRKVHRHHRYYRDETAYRYDYKIEKPSNASQQSLKAPEIKNGAMESSKKDE